MIRKDQTRALKAYEWAANAKGSKHLGDYEIAVQSFSASLLRSGFSVAVSVLERSKERPAFAQLLNNLGAFQLPGLPADTKTPWPERVRGMTDTVKYMQATRELIALMTWLRRACRALGEGDGG